MVGPDKKYTGLSEQWRFFDAGRSHAAPGRYIQSPRAGGRDGKRRLARSPQVQMNAQLLLPRSGVMSSLSFWTERAKPPATMLPVAVEAAISVLEAPTDDPFDTSTKRRRLSGARIHYSNLAYATPQPGDDASRRR
jgi:hypothetical protein